MYQVKGFRNVHCHTEVLRMHLQFNLALNMEFDLNARETHVDIWHPLHPAPKTVDDYHLVR